jgi:hypothetical protein
MQLEARLTHGDSGILNKFIQVSIVEVQCDIEWNKVHTAAFPPWLRIL